VQTAKRNEILERYGAHVERFDAMARDRRRRLGTAPRLAIVDPAPKSGISVRELAVLELIADGMPNVEIATRLLISEETVKSHVRSVLAKLRAHNRAHAVAIGLGLGLIPLKHQKLPDRAGEGPTSKLS
jgi:DNA-binding CsgD family transcriptional regulator